MKNKEIIRIFLSFLTAVFSLNINAYADDISFSDLAEIVYPMLISSDDDDNIKITGMETVSPEIRAAVSLGILTKEETEGLSPLDSEYFYRNPARSGMAICDIPGYNGGTVYRGNAGAYAQWRISIPKNGYYRVYFYNVLSEDNADVINAEASCGQESFSGSFSHNGNTADSGFSAIDPEKRYFTKNSVLDVSLTAQGTFNADCIRLIRSDEPEESVSYIRFVKAMADAFEIRTGVIDAPPLGQYFSDYTSLSYEERKYADKAVMIGMAENGGNFNKDRAISETEAQKYRSAVFSALDDIISFGITDSAGVFKTDDGLINKYDGGKKADFFHTLNYSPSYDTAKVILALYDGGKLVDVREKSYTGLSGKSFSILHCGIDLPGEISEPCVKAFVFDGYGSLMPVYEYRYLK